MDAKDLYREGKLTEAVARQNEAVRSKPSDVRERSFLGELLCLAGNLERADAQFETIEKLEPKSGPTVALYRQLIRAEKTRQEVHKDGRVPDFLGDPPEHVRLRLEASVALRAGDAAEAARLAGRAEEARPSVAGRCDGAAFDDFRDLDDLLGGTLEVLTSTGRLLWIPVERVVSIECDAPAQPLDLLWRPALMEVRDGPDGKVFLPAVYVCEEGLDDRARLARSTDWIDAGGDLVRGVGLRTFLVGEEARTLLELGRLDFEPAGA